MKIAIIGTGNVGGTLGQRWADAGHQITFGTRNPDSDQIKSLLATAGPNAGAATASSAVARAEVVVLATPWPVVESVIASLGDLSGKILVDCTNPIAPGLQLALGTTTSGGEQIAAWAPQARVVKAFNTTGAENMADPLYEGQATVMLICGDDDEAKSVVGHLAEALGFETVDVGPLTAARYLEPFALVWIRLATVQGLGRNIAFRLVRR